MAHLPTVLITGSTAGHGRALAAELAGRGWRVLVHGRDPEKVQEAAREVGAAGTYVADLASLAEVRRLADEVSAGEERLDVLVNNAGVFAADSRRRVSADGFELTFAVNHLAAFVLALRLLPLLRRSAPARVVNVASLGQAPPDFDDLQTERGWEPWLAYGRSKTAMIMATLTLAERLDPAEVTVNALHPATYMDTPMVRAFRTPTSTVAEGVAATLRLVADPGLAGVTGRFFDGTRETSPAPPAPDPRARARLWAASEELTGERRPA